MLQVCTSYKTTRTNITEDQRKISRNGTPKSLISHHLPSSPRAFSCGAACPTESMALCSPLERAKLTKGPTERRLKGNEGRHPTSSKLNIWEIYGKHDDLWKISGTIYIYICIYMGNMVIYRIDPLVSSNMAGNSPVTERRSRGSNCMDAKQLRPQLRIDENIFPRPWDTVAGWRYTNPGPLFKIYSSIGMIHNDGNIPNCFWKKN